MITLLMFFFFKKYKCLCIETVSGEVKLVFIILSLYLMPKVPIDATGILFALKIW